MSDNASPKPKRPVWQRMLGLRRRDKGRIHWVPTGWGWVLIVVFVGLLSMVGFAEYSM